MKRREFVGALGTGVAAGLLPGPMRASLLPAYRGRDTAFAAHRHFIERWSWAMGQPVHLQLFATSSDHGYAAAAAALAELRRVEHKLSRFDDTSDLSELNRRAGQRGSRVGDDLRKVLAHSLHFERLTQGGFDPAIEPLMRAWGFRTPRASEPTPAELEQARKAVLAARVTISDESVCLTGSDTCLDLGGIGVGYGLDRAMATLREAGIRSAFLDVSGDCMAIGSPPGQDGWLVDIAGPRPGDPRVASLRLCDAALATSTNKKSVVQYGRVARGHVINPDSGWPADALVQVSVVARTAIEADALSTAMLVSGRPVPGVLRYYKA